MSITEKFQALQTGEQIGLLLALAVVIVPAVVWACRAFIDYCESTPIYDPMTDGPEDLHTKLQGVESEYEADQIVGQHVSQSASSHLVGGLLMVEDPAMQPNSIRLGYPNKARYVINLAEQLEIQRQMLIDTHRVTKL